MKRSGLSDVMSRFAPGAMLSVRSIVSSNTWFITFTPLPHHLTAVTARYVDRHQDFILDGQMAQTCGIRTEISTAGLGICQFAAGLHQIVTPVRPAPMEYWKLYWRPGYRPARDTLRQNAPQPLSGP